MIKAALAFAFLGLNVYTYYFMAREAVVPARESFADFPLEIDGWRCAEPATLPPEIKRNLGATDYLICDYQRSAPPGLVSVYVGYHETQIREQGGGSGDNAIHPPAHCLPGSGWDIVANQVVELDIEGLPADSAPARRLVIAKGEARQLVYYWYQSRGRIIAQDWKKILFVGWDRATRGRTDGSLVRFTVPILRGDEEAAERKFRDLAPRIVTRLARYVPV